MNGALTPDERQLLSLVRSTLWQKEVDEEAFTRESADWQKIGESALKQTVGAIAFEGVLSLPENLRPPKEWAKKALTFIETNRRTHGMVDKCVAEAVKSLRAGGIDAVLLKGQAYARAYPRADMRQCGDIDLYVGERDYKKAYLWAKRSGWKEDKAFDETAKHYCCELGGVKIELHKVAAKLYPVSADRGFQEWSREQSTLSGRTITIGDEEIGVPTPTFDVFFVFQHLYHHFLNGGVGLRHLCDWGMLLHRHRDEIDRAELEERLKEFGLMSAWEKSAPITVDYLGLPETECPFYSKKNEKMAERILKIILKEGNFGRGRKRELRVPNGYMARKIRSFLFVTSNYMEKVGVDPKGVIREYVCYVEDGVRRVLRGR